MRYMGPSVLFELYQWFGSMGISVKQHWWHWHVLHQLLILEEWIASSWCPLGCLFLSLGRIYLYWIYSSKLLTMRPLSRGKRMKWQHYLVSKYSVHIRNTIETCRQCGVQPHELIPGNSCQLVRKNRKQKQSNMGTGREKDRQTYQALRNANGSPYYFDHWINPIQEHLWLIVWSTGSSQHTTTIEPRIFIIKQGNC